MNLLRALTAPIVLLLACAPALGQQAPVSSVMREAFAVRAFDDIDLPQGSVRAVHVGQRGFLWAGTREGLVQYKSGQQQIWQQTSDGENGLPSGMINALFEDSAGTLWVGTGRGIARASSARDGFKVVVQSPESREKQLNIADFAVFRGRLLAITVGGELLVVSRDSVTPLPPASTEAASGQPPLAQQALTSLIAAEDELYVGTEENGIYRLRIANGRYEVAETIAPGTTVVDLQFDGDSLIWLARDEGLRWRDRSGTERSGGINPLTGEAQSYYRAMAASSTRNAWFAAGPNVIRLRGGQADVVRLPGRGNEVRSIAVDPAGNIWIGTYYGLFYGLDTDFNSLRTAAAYDSGLISALAVNGSQLYIGGQNLWGGDVGSQRFDVLQTVPTGAAIQGLRVDPLSPGQDPVTALAASEDLLIVGYFVGGFDVVDLRSGSVENVTAAGGEPFDNVGVSALLKIGENRWLATLYYYGLVELTISPGPGPPRVSMRRIDEERTLIGIYRIDDKRFLAVSQEKLLVVDRSDIGDYSIRSMGNSPLGLVFAVEADGDGGAYLGIENVGVRHLTRRMLDDAEYLARPLPTVEQYLPDKTVWHLLLDEFDMLWATTNNGVYVFDLPRSRLNSHITYRDGLPANEFEYGPHASLTTAGGEKIFVSARGPVAFRQASPTRDGEMQLSWTDITIDGRSVLADLERSGATVEDRLVLPFNALRNSVLRIEYGYDDHVRALDATYAQRPDAGDDWLTGSRPEVVIPRRSSWEPISLEVAMLNPTGQVISTPLALRVDVTPPWYQIGPVDVRIALPVMIVTALLLILVQYRARQRERLALAEAEQRREIVEAEMRGRLSEKEILIREVHHRVGNLLSSFASNVRTMRREARSEETRDTLEHLSARIKVQSAVHQLLQRSDANDINVATMLRQVAAGARDLRGEHHSLSVDLHLDDIYMTYSKAQYLGLILNELLTNSFKYGVPENGGQLAAVSLRAVEGGGARFHYRDYGAGLGEALLAAVLDGRQAKETGGLAQTIALACELKGQPEIFNDEGMHFAFNISARIAYGKEARALANNAN